MARPRKNVPRPKEYALAGLTRLRVALESCEQAGRKAEFALWLAGELDAFRKDMLAQVEALRPKMSPAYLKKRPLLLDALHNPDKYVVPDGEDALQDHGAPIPPPAHTETVNEVPSVVTSTGSELPVTLEQSVQPESPAVIQARESNQDPVAASPGFPAECELYIEGTCLNRRYLLARLYDVDGGQRFRRVTIFRDNGLRPAMKVRAKLVRGGGQPCYSFVAMANKAAPIAAVVSATAAAA